MGFGIGSKYASQVKKIAKRCFTTLLLDDMMGSLNIECENKGIFVEKCLAG